MASQETLQTDQHVLCYTQALAEIRRDKHLAVGLLAGLVIAVALLAPHAMQVAAVLGSLITTKMRHVFKLSV